MTLERKQIKLTESMIEHAVISDKAVSLFQREDPRINTFQEQDHLYVEAQYIPELIKLLEAAHKHYLATANM